MKAKIKNINKTKVKVTFTSKEILKLSESLECVRHQKSTDQINILEARNTLNDFEAFLDTTLDKAGL